MADRKKCVNLTCNNIALYRKYTLCQKHYTALRNAGGQRWQRSELVKPTTKSEWEWIKEELNL